jgi:hypothetical protein
LKTDAFAITVSLTRNFQPKFSTEIFDWKFSVLYEKAGTLFGIFINIYNPQSQEKFFIVKMNLTENDIVDFNFKMHTSPATPEEYETCLSGPALPTKPDPCKICILVLSQDVSMPPRYYIASTTSPDTLTAQLNLRTNQKLVFGTVVQETYSAWRPFSHIGGGSFEDDWDAMCNISLSEKEGRVYAAWIVEQKLAKTRKKPLEIYADRYQRWGYTLVVSPKFTREYKIELAKAAFGDRYHFEWRMGNGKEVLLVTNPDMDSDILWSCPMNSDYLQDSDVLAHLRYMDCQRCIRRLVKNASAILRPGVSAMKCFVSIGSLNVVDKVYGDGEQEIRKSDSLLAWILLHGSLLHDRDNLDKLIVLSRLNWEDYVQCPQPRNIKVLRYNRMLLVLSEIECTLPYSSATPNLQKMPDVTLRSEQRDVLFEMMRRETQPTASYESQLFVKVADTEDETVGLYYSPFAMKNRSPVSMPYWASQNRVLAVGPSAMAPRKFGGVLVAELGWGKTVLAFALIASSSRTGPTLVVVPTYGILCQWKTMCDSMTTLKSFMYNKKYDTHPVNMPEDVDVVFTTYALMKKDSFLQTNPWGRAIYDEVHELQKHPATWSLECDVVWGLTATLASPENPNIKNIIASVAGFEMESEEIFLKKFAVKAPPSSQTPTWTVTESTVDVVLPDQLEHAHTQLEFELLAKEWPLEHKLAVSRLHKVAAGFYKVNVPYRRRLGDLVEDVGESSDANHRKRKMPDRLFEETECPICMEAPTQPAALVCGHIFCHDCIATWLRHTSKKCPICREVCGSHMVPVGMVKSYLENPPVEDGTSEDVTGNVDEFRVAKALELVAALDPTEKIVIFSHYNLLLQHLKRRLTAEKINHVDMQQGCHNAKALVSHLSTFDTDPECRVMLLNVRTQSAGLNLTAANNVLFMERPLESTWYTQGVGRVARGGQTRDVSVNVLVSNVGF